MSEGVRIHKALADAGVASRRKAEQLVIEGRVTVNGVTAGVGQLVDPGARRTRRRRPAAIAGRGAAGSTSRWPSPRA